MPTEDEIYRSSTQFRNWTFTPTKLAGMRKETNKLAKEHVRAAIVRRRKAAASMDEDEANEKDKDGKDIDFLTVEEEKTLVDYFCVGLLNMNDTLKFSSSVIATAIQYIKRFYLTNSVMSYHPRSIMLTALFLATKIEARLMAARDMASILNKIPSLENLTGEEIAAPEFVLTQGLLFNLDIRHPSRGLKGAYIELQMLLTIMKSPNTPKGLESLTPPDGSGSLKDYLTKQYNDPESFSKKINKAYAVSNSLLKIEAVLSDAYFLYTPPQIVLAALLIANEELALDMFHIRMSRTNSPTSSSIKGDKILDTARSCSELLKKANSTWREQLSQNAKTIDRKLHFCRNPDKADLVERHKAQKRDATTHDGKLDEAVAKKRKLEREKNEKEGDDLFGPALSK